MKLQMKVGAVILLALSMLMAVGFSLTTVEPPPQDPHLIEETADFRMYKFDFGILRPGPIQECIVVVGKSPGLGAAPIDMECQ
jgi:hypothetical protein